MAVPKIEGFTLESAGATAYNLIIGYVPDEVHVYNRTKWATDGTSCEFYWNKRMADGYAYAQASDIASLDRSIVTTNGISQYSASAITDISQVITGITAANPPVVTVTSTAGWVTGNSVRIRDVVGMTELNENIYQITVINTTTFSLTNVNATSFTAYASGGNAYNQSVRVENTGGYGITLGTTIMGADGDILDIVCTQYGQAMTNIGDVA